jgi:hypothetical protein
MPIKMVKSKNKEAVGCDKEETEEEKIEEEENNDVKEKRIGQ